MYKKEWCACKVVVLLIKPIVVLTFPLPSASLDLKVPSDGNENFKKKEEPRGLINKTTSHVHYTFLYISLPFSYNVDSLKMPKFEFYRERKQATAISLSEHGCGPWNSTSGGFAYI